MTVVTCSSASSSDVESSDSSSDESEEAKTCPQSPKEEAKPRRRTCPRSPHRVAKPIPIAQKVKARVQKASHEALTNEVVRQELKERIMKQNYANAFASIFPGKQNPYNQ